MAVFGQDYANAYDYLYQDKDYNKECDFLEKIFLRYSGSTSSILDLGCGTGGHVNILAEKGYKVTGIDRSGEMLSIARKKASERVLRLNSLKGASRM